MNNEPVAWMCPTGLEYKQRATDFMYNDSLYNPKLNWIPLYTHPVKELNEEFEKGFKAGKEEGWKAHKFHHPAELTDEEIDEISKEVWERPWLEVHRKFARAILRKAQEK